MQPAARKVAQNMAWLLVTTGMPRRVSRLSMVLAARRAVQEMKSAWASGASAASAA